MSSEPLIRFGHDYGGSSINLQFSEHEDERVVLNKRVTNGYKMPPSLKAKLICELLGTLIFVFFGAGCAAKSPDLLTAATAHGLVTIWLVYVLGPVSGGHFNAGATIAFAINGKMKKREIIGYLLAQGVGAVIAGYMLLLLYGNNNSTTKRLGTPALNHGASGYDVTVLQAFFIEFFCTIFLSFIIFFTTSYNSHKEAAVAIGLTVFSSFLVGADRDGAALNPWRWLGPAVASQTFSYYSWIYVAGPIGGFIVGHVFFRLYKLIWNI
ncbi:unnamed protein product [Didymodactylos carnosus]|uniref:Aquaporin n=1 Tax=Didymodactylos carnosus TaxID=1234261 RepID=A0A813YUL1_9BILA|nr:unnamed protein product [Didymodactylos carnosus]CAF0950985.1 unnamed protein product [Didymodactylos carnosus]CAF3673929.1 unnamed protein product [Didymodactylos carnosus]CAF3725204.1 unnamed protein product [Didymodactylos carnosus]